MTNDKYLQFIGTKIEKLETAIFSLSDTYTWKYPVSVIRNLKADDRGDIWFLMNNTLLQDRAPGLKFFAQIQFFNKALNYYINAVGYATIVMEEIELPDVGRPSDWGSNKPYRVCLRIQDAHYSSWERGDTPGSHRISDLLRWLFNDEIQPRSLHLQFWHKTNWRNKSFRT